MLFDVELRGVTEMAAFGAMRIASCCKLDQLSDTLSVFHCECGNTIKVSHDVGIMDNNNAPNYCSKCGCRIDWEEEDV